MGLCAKIVEKKHMVGRRAWQEKGKKYQHLKKRGFSKSWTFSWYYSPMAMKVKICPQAWQNNYGKLFARKGQRIAKFGQEVSCQDSASGALSCLSPILYSFTFLANMASKIVAASSSASCIEIVAKCQFQRRCLCSIWLSHFCHCIYDWHCHSSHICTPTCLH